MSETHRISPETIEERLEVVTDPELDRSIVELDYIEDIEIDGGSVEVAFTLPTAWCSPAFAWMMMADARDAMAAHPAVSTARIRLRDHMHAAEINEGVNGDLAFGEAFEDADGEVESVRRELDGKARVARQYRATESLLDGGLQPEQIARLRREDLAIDPESSRATIRLNHDLSVCVEAESLERYLEKALATGIADEAEKRLFVTPEGEAIQPSEFETVHSRGRLAATNMTGQGHVCENLGASRIGSPSD
ncbi:iron-sulfur cluster assembly protein [Halalkalicoccus subterraneus]|uniref:iron-sulfur cluster assembly protein n=1 Tax=Halalkalicoccus subterraneus TaxID=2675002 RepID=UPI000EFB861F|nr:iron-sulfur cluster assembly protein [Halalkalicoccus subterraneus]